MNTRTPDTDHGIDEQLVRDLRREQHPDRADEPIQLAAVEWANLIYRLGDNDAVLLARRSDAEPLI